MATAASDTEENIFGFILIFFLSLNVAWVHSVIPGHHSLFRVSQSSEPGFPFNDAESQKNLGSLSRQFAVNATGRFKFEKRSPFHPHARRNAPVVAVSIDNPDRSPLGIHSRDAAPTPTGFAEIVYGLSNRAFFQSNAVVDAIFGRHFLDRLSH
jgi:hypothetical protein